MKRILLFALVGTMLAACKKDKDYEFKSDEFVYLNGVEQPKFKSTEKQYTLAEIVRNEGIQIQYYTPTTGGDTVLATRVFWDELRDTVNNRLLFRAEDILNIYGELEHDFLDATEAYLTIPNGTFGGIWNLPNYDTCGYIPKSILESAREQIYKLYDEERYGEIYDLFHTAFTFYTCTGAEYKAIMENGGN